jgi:chromosome partitioning protein
VLILQALAEIGTTNFRVLLTKVPPPPESEGVHLRLALIEQKIPVFTADIPRLKVFEKAASSGVPVYDVKDVRAKRAWDAYVSAGKELSHGGE